MNIENISQDSIKYNTCKFRSQEPILQTIKRCSCKGGDYQISAYICYEREIFQVTEEICKECTMYQPK